MSNVLEISHLYKSISGKTILINVSLNVPKGSLFGLLGPNGAGKSTCLKLITGRMRSSSGSINVLGLNPWNDRVKLFHHVGYLPQNPTPPKDSSSLNFLTYMSRLKGFSKKDALIEARSVLARVGMEKFEGNVIGKLSGGETQRLAFANSLIGNPEILILDEPTASLDPEGRVYVMDLIQNMSRDTSQTVIVSSHILPEIQRMTNHIAILSEGEVLVSGNMRELTANIFDSEYEIETSHPRELFEILKEEYDVVLEDHTIVINVYKKARQIWVDIPRICHENNFELRSFKPMRDALENMFLRYVSRNHRGIEL